MQETMRSGPTALGASTSSGIGLVAPVAENGDTLKYFSDIHSSACCTGGTTFDTATAVTWPGSRPLERNNVWMRRPYWSAVCSRRVVSVHDTRSPASSHKPTLVLVLPTSRT